MPESEEGEILNSQHQESELEEGEIAESETSAGSLEGRNVAETDSRARASAQDGNDCEKEHAVRASRASESPAKADETKVSEAVELREKETESPSRSGDSESINFFSPKFDAARALATPGLQPPNPRVRPLDNLTRCRPILPEDLADALMGKAPEEPRPESKAERDRRQLHRTVTKKRLAAKARQVKIFDKIAEKLKARGGPLSLLAQCYEAQGRVRVWTRHLRGIRGSCVGFLQAFDKHMNLVLRDVDETYTVLVKKERKVTVKRRDAAASQDKGPSNEGAEGTAGVAEITEKITELRLFPKLEHRKRHLKQVFIRGESVVLISAL